MANPHDLRNCPTRTDGADALVAHKVTQGLCQERQRNRYHKCYSCAFNNVRVAEHGLPPLSGAEEPAPVPANGTLVPEPLPRTFVEIA